MYSEQAPSRAEIDLSKGPLVLEFGANWCGYCQRAQPLIAAAFAGVAAIPRRQVEDGPGRALGRSFRVKLWPTLIFLQDGVERARVVRPTHAAEVEQALHLIAGGS